MAVDEQFTSRFEFWWEASDQMVHLTLREMVQLQNTFYNVLAKVPKSERDNLFSATPTYHMQWQLRTSLSACDGRPAQAAKG